MITQSMTLSGKGLIVKIDKNGVTCNYNKIGKRIVDSIPPIEGYEPDTIAYIGRQILIKYPYLKIVDKEELPEKKGLIY
jgi:hypothetical protein